MAQLINVSDGFHLWSNIYDRDLIGVFEMQEEITCAIVDALKIRLTPAGKSRLHSPERPNPQAYELYLKSRYFCHRMTSADMRKSIEYIEQAIVLEPNYAVAYAALADAYTLWSTLESEPPWEIARRARQAAKKALELDDSLAEAHSAMGMVLSFMDWDWTGADQEYRLALELKPSLTIARMTYAVGCLGPLGRYEEAIGQLRQALTNDPFALTLRTVLAQTLVMADRPDEALDELRHVLDMEPGYPVGRLTLAVAYMAKGCYQDAIEALMVVREAVGDLPNYSGYLGYAHAKLGNCAEAERILKQLLDRFRGDWVPGVDVALIYNGLGNEESALHWLERAGEQRSFDAVYLRDDPGLRICTPIQGSDPC